MVNALITTLEQLEIDLTAAAELTVHVARLAASAGLGGDTSASASASGATRAASKK